MSDEMQAVSNTEKFDVLPLVNTLRQTWHRTIPVSEFMQIAPSMFNGDELYVTAPLTPNINLHNTMFAGSIYTLMTLTGWGMVWLQQQLMQVQGDIVLANADIKYIAPVTCPPIAKVRWCHADLTPLSRGRRVKILLSVCLYCDETLCATFEGQYVSLPPR